MNECLHPSFTDKQIADDPKDSELCLMTAKPGENPVEADTISDVQIDLINWV